MEASGVESPSTAFALKNPVTRFLTAVFSWVSSFLAYLIPSFFFKKVPDPLSQRIGPAELEHGQSSATLEALPSPTSPAHQPAAQAEDNHSLQSASGGEERLVVPAFRRLGLTRNGRLIVRISGVAHSAPSPATTASTAKGIVVNGPNGLEFHYPDSPGATFETIYIKRVEAKEGESPSDQTHHHHVIGRVRRRYAEIEGLCQKAIDSKSLTAPTLNQLQTFLDDHSDELSMRDSPAIDRTSKTSTETADGGEGSNAAANNSSSTTTTGYLFSSFYYTSSSSSTGQSQSTITQAAQACFSDFGEILRVLLDHAAAKACPDGPSDVTSVALGAFLGLSITCAAPPAVRSSSQTASNDTTLVSPPTMMMSHSRSWSGPEDRSHSSSSSDDEQESAADLTSSSRSNNNDGVNNDDPPADRPRLYSSLSSPSLLSLERSEQPQTPQDDGRAPVVRREASDDNISSPASQPTEVPFNDHGLPPVNTWTHHPVYVRMSPGIHTTMLEEVGVEQSCGSLHINDEEQPIPFETELFKGVAMIRIADIKSTPQSYFRGKKRKMQVAVQGKFKRKLRFDQVYSGQEFEAQLRNIPGKFLIEWALRLLRSRLPKTFKADFFGTKPYFLSPLVLTSQKIRVDTESTVQYIGDHDLIEDMARLGPQFTVGDDSHRRKILTNVKELQNFEFDTEHVYTFDYFQQYFRAGHFAIDLGVKLLDLSYFMGPQPLLLTMAKTMDTEEYLWKFELWHEKCLLDKKKLKNGGK